MTKGSSGREDELEKVSKNFLHWLSSILTSDISYGSSGMSVDLNTLESDKGAAKISDSIQRIWRENVDARDSAQINASGPKESRI